MFQRKCDSPDTVLSNSLSPPGLKNSKFSRLQKPKWVKEDPNKSAAIQLAFFFNNFLKKFNKKDEENF